ncbi:MAG: histidine kinase [Pseudomonadota bacterium]
MDNHHTHKYLRVFVYASIFWMVIGAFHLTSVFFGDIRAGENYELMPQRWVYYLATYFTWGFLTTFVYFLVERNPPSRESWRWLPGFVLTMLVWIVAIGVIAQSLSNLIWDQPQKSVLFMVSNVTPFLYLFNALKFIMTYGACAGIVYYRRLQDAKLELLTLERITAEVMAKKSQFQLRALQAQLSPHFLFNALNSISAMARMNDCNGIVKAVSYLADLLRYAVEATEQTEVVLDDELKFTANYVALQKIRFGDGFQYGIQVELVDAYSFCPPYCVQTLVENVFSHNELSTVNPVVIAVRVTQVDNRLSVNVENTVSTPVQNSGTGVALRNLTERLQLLYGASAQLSTRADAQRFSATITLPLRSEHD